MRVLFTTASLDPTAGGPARSVPGLATGLVAAGADVEIWVNEDSGTQASDTGFEGVVARQPRDTESWRGFDLIHDHGLWLPTNHRVAKVASRLGVPRVVSPRGMLEPWAINHRRWKKRIAWWGYQRRDLQSAALLHATSDAEANQFARLGLTSHVVTLPNGVNVPARSTVPFTTPRNGIRTAVFLSRVHPKKGLDLLAEAWAQVRPAGWQMRVIGPDEDGHRDRIKQLVCSLGISDAWTFEDAIDGSAKWCVLHDADLFILPTYSENFGIAVAEALAMGTPAITTFGAPWQGLVERRCGWWVNIAASSIASAIQEATSLPSEALKTMGSRGREWIESDFGWEAIGRSMLKEYRRLLEELA